MSDCKGCNGFNAGLGDYCPACLTAARQIERRAEIDILNEVHKQAMSHTIDPHMSHNKAVVPHCRLCAKPRIQWSHSYCRAHEAQRRAKQRLTIRGGMGCPPPPRIEV